ncbi:uncharacterized protein FRV6_08710 [Fusarium oxysporum]|uniref:Uncharacterized protein n=1 Tax=Fusarium oxysporum TaxID=5507 RepID=A0A2H3T785_FUSOX|nr:uncharacterized protein FRV6_08710 [Fusarium oxysporum]
MRGGTSCLLTKIPMAGRKGDSEPPDMSSEPMDGEILQ